MRHKKRRLSPADGSYVCASCGETIEITLDRTSGVEQEYVEDCPVCCRPNVIHVEFFEGDDPTRIWAEAE